MDVVRLFEARPENVAHSFVYRDGVFYNRFSVDGKEYSFEDEERVSGEIEYKRMERRFGKLGLYAILSDLYQEKMPWGSFDGDQAHEARVYGKRVGQGFSSAL